MKVWMRGRAAGFTASAAQNVARCGARQTADDRAVLREFAGDLEHAFEIAGRGNGEAGLDHIHPEFGQRLGHAQLLLQIHGEAGRLFAVAQGGVEDNHAVFGQDAEGGVVHRHAGGSFDTVAGRGARRPRVFPP